MIFQTKTHTAHVYTLSKIFVILCSRFPPYDCSVVKLAKFIDWWRVNVKTTASILYLHTETESCCVNIAVGMETKESICSANSAHIYRTHIPYTNVYSVYMCGVDIIKCHACMVLNMQALFILSVTSRYLLLERRRIEKSKRNDFYKKPLK